MLEKDQTEKFFVEEIKIIQDIIKRMAFNSFMIKGWAITLVIATLLLKGNKYQKDLQGKTTERCGEIPKGYAFYLWFKEDGYNKMGDWIEKAAKVTGR